MVSLHLRSHISKSTRLRAKLPLLDTIENVWRVISESGTNTRTLVSPSVLFASTLGSYVKEEFRTGLSLRRENKRHRGASHKNHWYPSHKDALTPAEPEKSNNTKTIRSPSVSKRRSSSSCNSVSLPEGLFERNYSYMTRIFTDRQPPVKPDELEPPYEKRSKLFARARCRKHETDSSNSRLSSHAPKSDTPWSLDLFRDKQNYLDMHRKFFILKFHCERLITTGGSAACGRTCKKISQTFQEIDASLLCSYNNSVRAFVSQTLELFKLLQFDETFSEETTNFNTIDDRTKLFASADIHLKAIVSSARYIKKLKGQFKRLLKQPLPPDVKTALQQQVSLFKRKTREYHLPGLQQTRLQYLALKRKWT